MSFLHNPASSSILFLAFLYLLPSTVFSKSETPLQIYEIAIKNDPSLKMANSIFLSKAENQSLSRGGLYPKINLKTGITRNREDVETTGVGASGVTYFDSHRIQLELKQALYNKDKFTKVDIADAEYQVAENEYKMAHQDLIMRVATTYFDVLTAQDKLDFTQVEKQAIAKQLSIIKQRLKAGKSTQTDLMEAQASYDLATAELILALDGYRDALEGLTQLTGVKHTQIRKLSDALIPPTLQPTDLDYWIETANNNSLEIQKERFLILNHKHEIALQKAGHHPTLDLVARYRIEETGGRFGDSNIDDQSIGLELDIPIYEGGRVDSRIRAAHLSLDESRFRLQRTERLVVRNIQKSYRAVINSHNRVNALKQAVVSSKAALAAITKGYKAGTRNMVDVLNSRRDLFKTQQNYFADRYNYAKNYLQLKHISGILNKDDLVTIDSWFK